MSLGESSFYGDEPYKGEFNSPPSMGSEKHITVRLTEQAHALLLTKAKEAETTMKSIASEAILMVGQSPKRGRESNERIEQLNFQAKKHKQIVIFQMLVACLGTALLGFIAGVMV